MKPVKPSRVSGRLGLPRLRGKPGCIYVRKTHSFGLETSQNLWRYLNCDDSNAPMVTRLEFGQSKTFWGANSWTEADNQSYQSIFCNNLPAGLVDQIKELDDQGRLNDYSEIGFLALGMDNSWMLESKGWIWSEGMDPELFEALQALPEGVSILVRHYSRDKVRQVLITGIL